jgi:protocatechuate 3,4-dioxygenase beta subunit
MNASSVLVSVMGVAAVVAMGVFAAPASTRRPPPSVGSTAIACHADEAGKRLLIEGVVRDATGRPVEGATVTAYNADATGLYNPANSETRVPRVHAKVTTDAQGRFQVLTVFPGPYPSGDEPAHVHFDAVAPTYKLSYATIWFEGDRLITPQKRAWADQDAETRIVPTRDLAGLAVAAVTIVLEEN